MSTTSTTLDNGPTEGPTTSPTPSPTLTPTTGSPTGGPTPSPTPSPTASPVLSGPSPITISNGAGTAIPLPDGQVVQAHKHLAHYGAIDGCTMAVAYAPWAAGERVWVYERTDESSQWSKVAELSGDSDNVHFGAAAIALKGNTIVVGTFNENNGAGAAYVFMKENGSWVRKTKLAPSGARDSTVYTWGSRFGFSVAVDNDENTIVVGAISADATSRNGIGYGAAYVFYKPVGGWENSNALQADHKIRPSTRRRQGSFGASVAIHGDTIVVGATRQNSAFVYRKNDDNTWGVSAECDTSLYQHEELMCATIENKILGAPTSTHGFAYVTSLSDSVLAVGDYQLNSNVGAVNIYVKNSSGDFDDENPSQVLVPNAAHGSGQLGKSVHLDGPNLVAGAPESDSNRGVVYLWTFDADTGEFGSRSELTAPEGTAGQLGWAVGSSAGSIFAGAPYENVNGHVNFGKLYTFGDSPQTCPAV